MSIVLVGVNHKTAPVEVRELLAFTDEACAEGLRALVDGEVVREGLIVSTCNRVEVLTATTSEQVTQSHERISNFLTESRNLPRDHFGIIRTATSTTRPYVIFSESPLLSIRWLWVSRRCWDK